MTIIMLKWFTGGIAAITTGIYLLRLNNASKTVVTKTTLEVRKISLSGIELKAIVVLQNPTSVSLSLSFPFVTLKHRDRVIGSSKPNNKIIHLSQNSEQSFSLSIASTGWLSLIQTLGADLVQKIRSGQQVTLEILATTLSKVNGIPYEQKDQIKLSI